MRKTILGLLLIPLMVLADTPPPNTVKAKLWSGDGVTSITASGNSINTNVTNSSLAVTGTFFQATQPVSLLALPSLAAGSATIGNVNINGTVPISGTITATNSANGATGSAVPAAATQVGGSDGVNLHALKVSSAGVLSVDGSAVTQPVSAASLPLPTGAATAAGLTTINTTLGTPFQAGGSIGNTSFGISGTLPAYAATPTFNLGTLNGAATAANQATANTSLSSITTNTGNIPAQGQALAAGSMPVVLPAAQISTLTPLSTITANAGSGTFATSLATLPALTAGSAIIGKVGIDQTTPGTTNGVVVNSIPDVIVTGPAAQAGTVNNIITGSSSASDCTNYRSVSVQITSTATAGTVQFEGSNDNVTFVAVPMMDATSLGSSGLALNYTPANSTRMWVGPCVFTFFRVRISVALTGGSVQAIAKFSAQPFSPVTQSVQQAAAASLQTTATQAGTWTVQPGNTANTTAWKVDGSAVTQPVSIATAPVLVAGSAIIGKVGIDQTTPGTTNGVQVNAALPAGTNVIGHVIVDTAPTTTVTQSGTWTVLAKAATPSAVTVKAAAVTVGTTAVRLTNDGLAPAATRVLLVAQLLSTSTANCFMGPSSVTSSGATRGIQMFAGQSFSFNNDAGDYYAICDATSQTFLITEQE